MAYLDPIDRVANQFWSVFQPPPDLSVSEWADAELYLSPEDSSEPGKFRVSRAPYQREMMDAVSDPSIKEVVFCTASQIGKALDISTPIPTPDGWKTMEDLVVGDKVFDELGQPCTVQHATEVMHNRKCFKVEFSDGATLVADAQHQWYVEFDRHEGDNKFKEVLTTQDIFDNQHWYSMGKRRNRYAVPMQGPLDLPDAELPVDPYLLGAWLGDGYKTSARIICHADDVSHFVSQIEAAGHVALTRIKDNGTEIFIDKKLDGFCKRGHELNDDNTYVYEKCGPICKTCLRNSELSRKYGIPRPKALLNFSSQLRDAGAWRDKNIPAIYLRGSKKQRMELLQGLMDTDGYIGNGTARCEFVTTSKAISAGFGELLSSLGIKFTVAEKFPTTTYKGKKVNGKPAFRFSFLVYSDTPVFRMQRKLDRMVSRQSLGPNGGARRTQETLRRRIVNVSEVDSVPVKCIQVDSKSHLYLAGDRMVPTHNSLISKAVLGYHIHQDPGPILVIQPTTEMAETFSKDRLAPMIRDTPALRDLIADPKSRNSGNTVLHKGFRGGHITMIGSNAPAGLASRPIRIVFADEVDRFPTSAGTEGDPLFLARQRSVTFHNRKFIMASTPTIEGSSRIWKAFEKSDQRYLYLPCPHCGEFHTLKFGNMHWDDRDPTSARMVCTACGAYYTDADKMRMLVEGEWRAHQPFSGTAGFHISALYSPWQKFSDVVQEFLDKKDHPETMKTFVNLQLGECWEDRSGETVDHAALMARRESWDINAIPDDVVLITAGIDTQDDRLECTLLGWTGMEQARVLDHLQLWGNPGDATVWTELDAILQAQYQTDMGRLLRIRAACIDSGGSHTQRVYEFCRSRANRKVFPIKGRQGSHPLWPNKVSKSKLSNGVQLYLIGVDTGKDMMRSAFAVANPDRPRYVSFAADLPDAYFVQLVSEKRHTGTNKAGFPVVTWRKPQGVRNEALDCFNYAQAALEALKASGVRLKAVAQNVAATRPRQPVAKPAIPVEAMPVANTVRQPMRATRRQSSAIL